MRDDFVGSDGQLLENRSGWTLDTDGRLDLKVLSNQLEATDGGSGGRGFYKATAAGADGYVETQITKVQQNGVWLACRVVGVANFVAAEITGTGSSGLRLIKVVSGTEMDLITTQPNADDIIRIEYEGTTYRLFVNGSQVGSDQTVADGDIATSTDAQGFVVNGAETTGGAMYEYFDSGGLDVVKVVDETININEPTPSVEDILVREVTEVMKNEENRQFTVSFAKVINEVMNIQEVAEFTSFLTRIIDETLNIQEATETTHELVHVVNETMRSVEAIATFLSQHVIAPEWRSVEFEAEDRSVEIGDG